MRGFAVASAVMLAALSFDGRIVAVAAPETASATTVTDLSSQDLSSQDLSSQNARPRRARTRIRVTPQRRTGRLVRECDFRLVQEVRASGSYVVPRQRCWWARR